MLLQQFAAQEIGARIAQARREADGMTQETLAEALDLSVRQLQNIEAGASIPWKHFSRLEVIFEKPLAWFLHGEEPARENAATMADLSVRLEALEGRVAELAPAEMVENGFAALRAAIQQLADRQEPRDARQQ